jgi:hypothetical protein
MRNYGIDYSKLLGRLIPLYLAGNKFKLFMKALVYPLQSLADAFAEWGRETNIEAAMTSQVIMLEWYLNYKFRNYFANQSGSIHIETYIADLAKLPALFTEDYVAAHHDLAPALYRESNSKNSLLYTERRHMYSFYVYCPAPVSSLNQGEYANMVRAIVNRYKLSSKSFLVIVE